MSKRSFKPPLYELMNRHGDHRDGVPAPPRHAVEDEPPSALVRTVRIPAGYLLLAAAGVAVLGLLVYMIAFRLGEQAARTEFDRRFLETTENPAPASRAADPLLEPPAPPRNRTPPSDAHTASPAPHERVGSPPRSWGPIDSDPRHADLYYLVLAETRREGAWRLAEFCRQRGLEAYVTPSNNKRFRVFVLPGLPAEGKVDPREQPLRDQVFRIGDAWKAQHAGESNLRDAYLRRYRPDSG